MKLKQQKWPVSDILKSGRIAADFETNAQLHESTGHKAGQHFCIAITSAAPQPVIITAGPVYYSLNSTKKEKLSLNKTI